MEYSANIKSYLIEKRHISLDTITDLESKKLIKCHQDKLYIAMRDIDGNKVGTQIRYTNPIDGIKSKTKQGDHVGYFYTTLNFSQPIIITEGEADRISLAHESNVVGLQGIANLKKLVAELQAKGVPAIYLLVDNDDAADVSIEKLFESLTSLDDIFDCRGYLENFKDINDYIVAGNVFDKEKMISFGKALIDSPRGQQYLGKRFIIWNNNRTIVDHNSFAKHIIQKYHIQGVEGALFCYDQDIWKSAHKNQIDKIIIQEMENILLEHIDRIKNTDRNQIYDFVVTHAENNELKKKLNEKNVNEINLSDGILDVKKREFRSYSKNEYKLHKLEYTWDILQKGNSNPEKRFTFLDQILEGWENKQEIINFLQEFFGYLFIPNTKFERSLLLYGSGANGKGVFLDIIRHLLGEDTCINVGMHEINKDQNLFMLLGKLANLDSDMQQGVQLDSGIIKKIISGEPIVGKAVYQKPISFTPYTRLVLATNELPYLKSADYSIKRRFVFIHLKKSFVGQEDPTLKDKLKEEKNQIFIWAIQGLKRLLDRGEFLIPIELKKDVESFIKENDSVTQFLDSGEIYIGKDLFISNKNLYSNYSIFCKDCGFKPLGLIKLGNRLVEKGFQRHTDGRERGIIGLGVTER